MDPRSIKILLGQDNAIVALDLENKLRHLGYVVESHAGTPEEVVYLAITLSPDVIVLDFDIARDAAGTKLAKEIEQIAGIPIVFVTTYESDLREIALGLSVPYRHITKPFVIRELHEAIRQLLEDDSSS